MLKSLFNITKWVYLQLISCFTFFKNNFSNMQIPKIKSLLTITQVLAHYNYKPDTNAKMCCPFHNDSTPSMQVYEATNTVYCFSSNCKTHGKSMDVIDFIMQQENCSKHEALLKCKMIIGMAEQKPATLKITKPTTKQNLDELFTTLTNNLPQSEAAKNYCAKIGRAHV